MLDAVSAPFCNFSFCALVSILLNINEKVMIEKKRLKRSTSDPLYTQSLDQLSPSASAERGFVCLIGSGVLEFAVLPGVEKSGGTETLTSCRHMISALRGM
jgi:hypothetical protein